MVSRYVSTVPVKPEGLCLLPPPHQSHYRMLPPQRSDGFHVTTTPPAGFVPQQSQNQPPNQGGSIRGMASAGPPTQASTPPQSEQMKQMQQQTGQISMAFVTQPVRATQNYHYRTPPPGGPGGPRMTNHHRQVPATNQIYTQHMPMYPTPIGQQMTTYQLPMQSYGNAPRTPYYPQQQFTTMIPGQFLHGTFPTQQPQTPQATYYSPQYNQPMTLAGRQGPPGPSVPSTPQGSAQPPQPSMAPSLGPQQQSKKKKRDKAIPIINPFTGKNINDEEESLPLSGDSSARETPQPNSNMMVVAEFAARVAIVASEGKMETPEVEPVIFPQNAQPPMDGEHLQKLESVVQNSKLQVSTKEFVPDVTKLVPKENSSSVDSNRVEVVPVVASPTKLKPNKQPPVKELETVFVNKELVHEPQIDVQKVNKVVKVKSEPLKTAEQPVKEAATVEESVDKSKRAQQKVKESAPVPVAASKQTAPVPGSQPPKPTSKGNKMRELNMKGAIKEGTDMDAISSADVPAVTENCNQQPQQQSLEQSQQQSQQQAQQKDTPPETVAPVIDTPPVVTLPSKPAEVKTIIKNKVDVTSIVKDVPKNMKPFIAPAPVAAPVSSESQDETDRAVTEKLVQVKNEANIKANSAEMNDNQDNDKNVIRYKKDQWSPKNTAGKKCYDRDFLINLQSNPICKKKPDNLPDLDVILKDGNNSRISDTRSFQMNRQSEVLMPAFHKSLSQRGPLPKRNSQQGKASSKSGKPNAIHVTLSLKEDVKLRETENAWKPARLNASAQVTEDELKTAVLYKKVRGVLNKLTPEKFDKLLIQVRDLTIDNAERLQGVIDLVFEKAVDEPNFSVAYALMCKQLALMQVPAEPKNKNDTQEFVNFRKLLITRCQLEFEKNSIDENARNIKIKEIEECADPEKKKELQLLLEEEDRRMRVKSVGNIRFIGELFKQQMLTVSIMLRCINILLQNKDEDSLECLCKLLTTIGKDLELTKNQKLTTYFTMMQEIVDKKHGKISSRVRFMLQDVIDLRQSKWKPRRQDLNPKTMEQIQKEADTEQLNIQVMNSGPMNTPRKDDRLGGSVSGSDRKKRNNVPDDGGWSMATPRGRTPYTVESSKLMNKPPPLTDMTLGSKSTFGQWGRGSNIKNQQPSTANMYAPLENINSDQDKSRSGFNTRLAELYTSKGPIIERTLKQSYESGRGSRSGSQHRNSQQRPAPSPSPSMKREQEQQPLTQPPQPQISQITPEQLQLKMRNIIDEYLNDNTTLAECAEEIKESIGPSKMQEFVTRGYNDILDCSDPARFKIGILFAYLIKNHQLTVDDYCKSLEDFLSYADDLFIDIPKLWNYLAQMIVPLITENVITLYKLNSCMNIPINQQYAAKLFAELLQLLYAEKGPGYVVELWQTSGVSFTDFMPEEHVNSFIKENKFDFMIGGAGTPVMQSPPTWEQVHNKLLEFFKSDISFDAIIDWISANVGERVKDNKFIRILATAMCENAVNEIRNVKQIRIEVLMKHFPLLQRFIDNQEAYEMQCIFALQFLVHQWEHPPGILQGVLEKLWEQGLICNESFEQWKRNDDPKEMDGKAMAIVSLQRLFTALDESDSSTAEDA